MLAALACSGTRVAMSQGNVPITPEGHQRHTDELKQLKSVARPKVIQEIA